MINGNIEFSRYPRIHLDLIVHGQKESLKFLIDTGFDSELALSYNQADLYELELLQSVRVTYADGESNEELIAVGKIGWFGQEREVRIVLSNDEEPAIGTRLFKGCVMTMNFIDDKLMIDKPLSH
jgi:predicted aspartyl protease